jgi:hypothetical protein
MIKSKLSAIAVVLAILAVVCTGCSTGSGAEAPVEKVTGVTLSASDGSDSDASIIYYNSTNAHLPASVTFTVTVSPSDAANKAVTWTVTPDTYVTWDETTRTVTAKAVGGPTTVTVKTADGGHTAAWTVTVEDPANYVAVTDVAITTAGPLSFAKTGDDFSPQSILLEWTVSPDNATNKSVHWSVQPEGVVTVERGLVTPLAEGDAVITLTSVDNHEAVDVINVKVTVGGTLPSDDLLKLVNLGTPTGLTTTTMPAMNAATKRYTVTNDIPTAQFVSAGVTDATIMYFDYGATQFSSISARVRITQGRKSGSNYGVIMGLMTDPSAPIAARGVNFSGMRVTTGIKETEGGNWRPYTSRPDIGTPSNNSAALAVQNSSGYGERRVTEGGTNYDFSTIDGADIPYTEEFIIEAARTGSRNDNKAGVYTIRLYTNAAETAQAALIASYSTGNNDDLNISVAGKPAYLGFIIANAAVEISQITIKEDAEILFTSPVSTPAPVPVAGVEFTVPAVEPTASAGEYTWVHSIAGGNSTLVIGAKALPARAPEASNINWTASGPATLSANTGSSVTATFSGAGEAVVTASAGDKSAKLTITVSNEAILIQNISVTGSGSVMAGNGTEPPGELQFSADLTPSHPTDPSVTWSISASSTYAATTTVSNCSISTGGLLTAPDNYTGTDFSVYVFAKANDSGGSTSTGKEITVKGYTNKTVYQWAIGSGGNFSFSSAGATNVVNGVTWLRNNNAFTISETSGVTLSGNRFVIGSKTTTNTSSSVMVSDGELDLSKAAVLTIDYSSFTLNGTSNFMVLLNNNTTSQGNSVLGNASRIYQSTALTATGGTVTVNINPTTFSNHTSLSKSFLMFRTEGSTSIVITGIKIEYVD